MTNSTQQVIGLLNQYNKQKNVSADTDKTRFATSSYANKYDYAYDKYSSDKNFNTAMWHDAFQRGDQDQYVSFLEVNKAQDLGSHFYDPAYYDYERMMLEMYKTAADDVELEERFTQVYDAEKEKFVEQSLGEMTEKSYLQYQIDQTINARTEEINAQFAQWRDKQKLFWEEQQKIERGSTLGHDVLATGFEFGEGILTGLAGLTDTVLAVGSLGIIPYVTEGFQGNYLDAFATYFAENGFLAAEKETVRAALDEYERLYTSFRDIDGNITTIGKYVAGISNSIGMMIPAIATNAIAPGAGMYAFYAGSSFAQNMYDVSNNPLTKNSPGYLKILNSAAKSAAEAGVEVVLGKFLGGTVQNNLLGLGGGKGLSKVAGSFSKTTGLGYLFKSAAQEGLEESLQDMSTFFVDSFTGMIDEGYGQDGLTFQTLVDSFLIGATASLVMSGGMIGYDAAISRTEKGKADEMHVEVDGKVQKLNAVNKFYLSTVVSDFNNAVKDLESGKVTGKKGVKLAQQIYGAFSTMTELYSSFDSTRIKNAEKLLSRVIADENKVVNTKGIKGYSPSSAATFATVVSADFKEMMGGSKLRLALKNKEIKAEDVEKATTNNLEKFKANRMNELRAVVSENGVSKKSKEVEEIEQMLSKDAEEKAKKLAEDYDALFVTDGSGAIALEKIAYVSQAWLDNYKLEEIYKYLAEEKIVSLFVDSKDKEMTNFMKSYTKFYKEFTKSKKVDPEKAIMELLFNQTVFQTFLISTKNAKSNELNMFAFKKIVFNLYNIVKLSAEREGMTERQKAYLNKSLKQIQDNMRLPVMKAVLNWNMDPQKIGADTILTQGDRDYITQYRARSTAGANVLNSGKVTQAYSHMAKDIMAHGKYTESELETINRGLAEGADEDSRLRAILLLNIGDDMSSIYSERDTHLVNISPEAFLKGDERAEYIQLRDDAFKTFENIYGVSPQDLYANRNTNKAKNWNIINRADTQQAFVVQRLEKLLGKDYIVVGNSMDASKFVIVKAIYDKELLSYDEDMERSDYEGVLIETLAKADTYISQGFSINRGDVFKPFGEDVIRNAIPAVKLNDVLKGDYFKDWILDFVYLPDADFDGYTVTNDKAVIINLARSWPDMIETFTHELNHVIQGEIQVTNGSNQYYTSTIPGLISYVGRNYSEVVMYYIRKLYDYNDTKLSNIRSSLYNMTDNKRVSEEVFQAISYVAYRMIQGELFAERYAHNIKHVKGISQLTSGEFTYYESPDGLKLFSTPFVNQKTSSSVSMSIKPEFIKNAVAANMAQSFKNILMARGSSELEALGQSEYRRDTFHGRLSRYSNLELVRPILNPGLSVLEKVNVTINEIITNPEHFLHPDIADSINNDFYEGNIYYFLKDYFENEYEGVSIDRDNIKHEYIFVDDNAADDLLNSNMYKRAIDETSEGLFAIFADKRTTLEAFYRKDALKRMGIPSNIEVLISENNTSTQFVIDNEHPNGIIYIKVNALTADYELINMLNHEFRHVIQMYHNFEKGFTPDFELTSEMLKDIKKNVPDIFTDEELRKRLETSGTKDIDNAIGRYFVYHMVQGEINAYGIQSSLLNTKPAYVTYEAGQPRIFMPWYNSKTNEGRYDTKFLAGRADDAGTIIPKVTKPATTKPKEKKKSNYIKVGKAKDTNLQYFVDRAKALDRQPQLNADLQDFVVATTGHDKNISPALMNAIKKGILTKQHVFRWFRNTKKMTDFEFDLMNKYFFHNDKITSLEELDKLTGYMSTGTYWAAAIAFKKAGLSADSFLQDNDIEKFTEVIDGYGQRGTPIGDDIKKIASTFDVVKVTIDGKTEKKQVDFSDALYSYARVLTMLNYSGTMASVWGLSNAFRSLMALEYVEKQTNLSIDEEGSDKGETLADRYQFEKIEGIDDNTIHDIEALYEHEIGLRSDKSKGDMITEMIDDVYVKRVDKLIELAKLPDKTSIMLKNTFLRDGSIAKIINNYECRTQTDTIKKTIKRLKTIEAQHREILQRNGKLREKYNDMTFDDVALKYNEFTGNVMMDKETDVETIVPMSKRKDGRARIQNSILSYARQIKRMITKGEITFKVLSKDVQDMFDVTTERTTTGKKVEVLTLKGDIYKVTRGRVAQEGLYSEKRFLQYAHKTDLSKDYDYAHDVTAIQENRDILREELSALRKVQKETIAMQKDTKSKVKQMSETIDAKSRQITLLREENKELKGKLRFATKFNPKKTKKTKVKIGDVTNTFVINSGIEMPDIVKQIYDTSFEEFANTEVTYASRDEQGNLLTKDNKEEFESATTHEITNWKKFYEDNKVTLSELTRTDVLDIVEFIQRGAITLDGSSGKLKAFEIYLLGYILDGGRQGAFDLSKAEVDVVEKVFESKASEGGFILNAVRQMQKTINPFKTTRQMMFNEFGITEFQLQPLEESLFVLQKATNQKEIAEAIGVVESEMAKVEKLMADNFNDMSKDKIWSPSWYEKVKSARYTFMLSSPTTWVRNYVSNFVATKMSRSADRLSSWLFTKKGLKYKVGQWDLSSKTEVKEEVKDFINDVIVNTGFLENLYEDTSKYDTRFEKFSHNDERGLFMKILTENLANQFIIKNRYKTTSKKELAKITSEAMTKASAFVSNRISDKRYIQKAITGSFINKNGELKGDVSKGYFGKMLTLAGTDLSKGLSNEVLNLFAEAVILANFDYMHKTSALGEMISSLRKTHPKWYEVLTWWQPFINSSVNWWIEAMKYTPVGLLNVINYSAKLEKRMVHYNELRDKGMKVPYNRAAEFLMRRDIGKGFIGLMSMMLGMFLGAIGKVDIDEDDDKFYLLMGDDIKVDISNVFGSSGLLVGMSLSRIGKDSFDDIMGGVADYLSEGFIYSEVLERHQWDQNMWENLLTEGESVLKSFTPQIVQLTVRVLNNKKIKYSSGMAGVWERYINTFVPGQPAGDIVINPYTGEPETKYSLPYFGEFFKSGILGPKIYFSEVSEGERLCREYGINKSQLSGELTVDGIKYQLDVAELNETYGDLNRNSLATVTSQSHYVQMPDGTYSTLPWAQLSDKQRANVLNRLFTENAKAAKEYLYNQM